MRQCLILRKWQLSIFILLIIIVMAGSLLAAEGKAYLSFQKTVTDKVHSRTYTIKKGDTITRILRRLGIIAPSYDILKKLNPHFPDLDKIYPGQKLILAYDEGQQVGGDDSPAIRNYIAKKGDSLTRIIVYELKAKPEDVVNLLRSLKRLNPELANVNKIYPGQTIKLPDGRGAVDKKIVENEAAPVSAAAVPPAPENTSPLPASLIQENTLASLRHIIGLLKGALITSGNYYIPLPDSGQVTIDCTTIPIVELDDGTTILLDFTKRLPDELVKLIRENWQNYQLVRIDKNDDIASILKKVMLVSKSYAMTKAVTPIFLEDEPQVKLFPDWVISKKAPQGRPDIQLGLFFAADKAQLLPRAILAQASKKGINVCEILADKVQPGGQDAPVNSSPILRIAGKNNEELLQNFFIFLGLEALRDQEVKVFDTIRDGFNLSIKAEWLIKRGGRTALMHKNKLPQQFIDVLRSQGMEPLDLPEGTSKKSLLEATLPALGIPCQFAIFSMPEGGKKEKFGVSFSALKIDNGKGPFYLIDFDMDANIYGLMTDYWKLNIIRY